MSEVLVSLLVMSIGVISLATLFPLSVLRSVEATQLTNATVLRKNAEALFDLFPPGDPRNPFTSVPAPAAGGTLYIVDPLGCFLRDDGLQYYGADGVPGATGVNDNPAAIPAITDYFGIGAPDFNEIGLGDDNAIFGFPTTGTIATGKLRYPGGIGGLGLTQATLQAQAERLVTLPDSWVTEYDGEVTAQTKSSVDVADSIGSSITISKGYPTRVILFGADGHSSQTRIVTSITGKTVSWAESDSNGNMILDTLEDFNDNGVLDDIATATSFNALPTSLGTVAKARIQKQERRYTWLTTFRMRPEGTNRTIDRWTLVVFFNRGFTQDDEQIYQDTGSAAPFVQNSATISIDTSSSAPTIRRGSYVLDVDNLYWYRITNHNQTNTSVNPVTITLDRPAVLGGTKAIFMPGIVEVYDLAPRTFP